MNYSPAYRFCVFLLLAARTHVVAAVKVIVGVNVMGVDQIGDAQQEALARQLQDNGVKTIARACFAPRVRSSTPGSS